MRAHPLPLMMAAFLVAACAALPATTTLAPSPDDEAGAQRALSDFFRLLNEGRYNEAALLYGGSYESMRDHNPSLPPTDFAALMRNACEHNGVHCSLSKSITLIQITGQQEFLFDVEFRTPDGSLFVRGPCCGASPTDQPPQSVFPYRVIRSPVGRFLVTQMPPYVP